MSAEHLTDVTAHFGRLVETGNWSRLYELADGFTYHFHLRRQRVLELLSETLGKLLSLGSGTGVMVESLVARGATFDGVDLFTRMLDDTNRNCGNSALTFFFGDIEALNLPSERYNQIICVGLLEYLTTPDHALQEISRVLRPPGIAVVTIPRRFHIDHLTVPLPAPLRALFRTLATFSADRLPRLRSQPDELNMAAARDALVRISGSQYQFTLIPYPSTTIAPKLSMRFTLNFERRHFTRAPAKSLFAHGYIAKYQKVVAATAPELSWAC
jgi:ubiquinone/menaquinone biosynthesis C-methylase UbiE